MILIDLILILFVTTTRTIQMSTSKMFKTTENTTKTCKKIRRSNAAHQKCKVISWREAEVAKMLG